MSLKAKFKDYDFEVDAEVPYRLRFKHKDSKEFRPMDFEDIRARIDYGYEESPILSIYSSCRGVIIDKDFTSWRLEGYHFNAENPLYCLSRFCMSCHDYHL